jgi:hypothetical protein
MALGEIAGVLNAAKSRKDQHYVQLKQSIGTKHPDLSSELWNLDQIVSLRNQTVHASAADATWGRMHAFCRRVMDAIRP